MGRKPLTPEQRKEKTEREKARRARLKAEKEAGSSTATSSSKKTQKAKGKSRKGAKGESETASRGTEVDLRRVAPKKAKGMLVKVHKLEKAVEKAASRLAVASQARRAARADLEMAQDALQNEIQDQRYGPGPLFAEGGNPDVGDGEGS